MKNKSEEIIKILRSATKKMQPPLINQIIAEYGKDPICVDTHVHRISNRLGLIKTKTAEETEEALKKILPQKHWIEWNKLLVIWGQNVCTPRSPKCANCALFKQCERVGVVLF